ncbi:hypothetical protein DFS33DRAFT_977502 [Desarmillaria ectypa]|nr:hypothetical protein DFS33DRAFT_977502 [Desarmillaria ectypa]
MHGTEEAEMEVPNRPLLRGQAICALIMIITGTPRSAGVATLRPIPVRCLAARTVRALALGRTHASTMSKPAKGLQVMTRDVPQLRRTLTEGRRGRRRQWLLPLPEIRMRSVILFADHEKLQSLCNRLAVFSTVKVDPLRVFVPILLLVDLFIILTCLFII